jgi:hypothetical protein
VENKSDLRPRLLLSNLFIVEIEGMQLRKGYIM